MLIANMSYLSLTYFVKSTPPRALSVSFLMHSRYVTDILKMCMKKFNAEKIIFDKFTGFWSAHCGGILYSLLAANLLFIYIMRITFLT